MFLAMFATMTTLIVGSIWNQHRESRAARRENTDQINQATTEFARQIERLTNEFSRQIEAATAEFSRQIEAATAEFSRQIEAATAEFTRQIGQTNEAVRRLGRATDRLSAEMSEHKQITAHNHRSTQGRLDRIDGSLSDARERLARIEGHLRISPQPPKDPETRDTGSDAA